MHVSTQLLVEGRTQLALSEVEGSAPRVAEK